MKKYRIYTLILALFFSLYWGGEVLANIEIVNGLIHEKEAISGETYETIILIKNSGLKPEQIRIYLTDFYFHADGRQYYSEPGKLDRSNSNWITYYPRNCVILAGETIELKCIIQVPGTSRLVGTYWSMILVEGFFIESPSDQSNGRRKRPELNTQDVTRYGIQMITHIDNSGSRKIKFLSTELLIEESNKILQVDVENVGERWLNPLLFVEVYTQNRDYIGKFDGGKWRIYPGTSVRYRIDLTPLKMGRYIAMIIVDNLDENIFGKEISLDINK